MEVSLAQWPGMAKSAKELNEKADDAVNDKW